MNLCVLTVRHIYLALFQKSRLRYFHPPSASTTTILPSSISLATLIAWWTAAPEDKPAKIPSLSKSSLVTTAACWLVTIALSVIRLQSQKGGTSSPRHFSPWILSSGGGSTPITVILGYFSFNRFCQLTRKNGANYARSKSHRRNRDENDPKISGKYKK